MGISPHPAAWELLALLRAHGLVPVPADEWHVLLGRLFGADPPGALGHSKLLYFMHMNMVEHPDESFRSEGRRLLHWVGDDFSWFSGFNRALGDVPLRVMRTSPSGPPSYDADIEAYVLRGPDAAERLVRLAGPDEFDADDESPQPSPDWHNTFDGRPTDEDDGFVSLYYLEALQDLARRVDRELEACGAAHRLYYLGTWGREYRDSTHDLMSLSLPAFAAELAALGYRMTRASDVSIGAAGAWDEELEIDWPSDRLGPDDDWME
ncbi:hypothetical protein [Nannocystis punicea]|uniref:Uncharacterized protein n=1 Tax=Nannocystis punicea TaxID=2995304 RepID=A0ABY7HBH1_9BACT|nr:hypothetical protein [Nannocystis poenicansa]WAS96556.1 hypothetical protein O0S08_10395 [Nannocystis poenicansa]